MLCSPPIREINQQLHPFKPLYLELLPGVRGYVYLLVSIPNPKVCYFGETDNLKWSLRLHNINVGYGDIQTRPTRLHPCIGSLCLCGFEVPELGQDIERRKDFFDSLQHFDISRDREYAYGMMKDEVICWNLMGLKSLVLVRCGELVE